MAFGAVAVGSIKAKEAAKVAGIMSNSGSTSKPVAVAASTGMTRVVVAVLLVNSVSQTMRAQTEKMATKGGNIPQKGQLRAGPVRQAGMAHALGQGEAAAEQDQNPPRNFGGGHPRSAGTRPFFGRTEQENSRMAAQDGDGRILNVARVGKQAGPAGEGQRPRNQYPS